MSSCLRSILAALALVGLMGTTDARAGDGDRSDARAGAAAKRRTVVSELRRLRDAGLIDGVTYAEHRDAYYEARKFRSKLTGRRYVEMDGVLDLLDSLAARRLITPARLEPLWLTLERNREWWSEGPLLSSGRRVSFDGSELVWQYFPGQGLALHPLGNFGKLNALWRSRDDARMELLLDELLALAVDRAGGVAWEYYFAFGGGRAPWVSAMAQGTALQSIARAASRLGRSEEIIPILRTGLAVFRAAPPEGVRVDSKGGAHYLLYSFSPGLRVLNGFIQSLIGLHDFGELTGDEEALRLFAEGDAAARKEVPEYDTGAWSLYSRDGRESNLNYHTLVTGFLENLCERTFEPVYCDTGENFRDYVREDPVLELVTGQLRGGTRGAVRFDLSKISRVGIRISRGGRVYMSQAFTLSRGRRAVLWHVPRRRGTYRVRLTGVDLAGNTAQVHDSLEVLEPRKRKRRS